MGEKNSDASDARRSLVCILLIAFGIVLILASWTPLGRVASQAMWTSEDSAAYSKIRQQSHYTAYQSPARAGITEAQRKAQQERLKTQAEAMRKKLERARQQPQRWSQYLLWSGALFTACGFLGHIANNRE
ncbi:MAG: hypothetical protein GXP26_01025 [Planctomycetes bacterium]|nr:hypothetical protein [Planctomycetota bacterium]